MFTTLNMPQSSYKEIDNLKAAQDFNGLPSQRRKSCRMKAYEECNQIC